MSDNHDKMKLLATHLLGKPLHSAYKLLELAAFASAAEVDRLRAEVERLQALNVGLAERVAAQSELLMRRAAAAPPPSPPPMRAYFLTDDTGLYVAFGESATDAAGGLVKVIGGNQDTERFSVSGSWNCSKETPIDVGRFWMYFTNEPLDSPQRPLSPIEMIQGRFHRKSPGG